MDDHDQARLTAFITVVMNAVKEAEFSGPEAAAALATCFADVCPTRDIALYVLNISLDIKDRDMPSEVH